MKRALLISIAALTFGLAGLYSFRAAQIRAVKAAPITIDTSEGFVDIALPIADITCPTSTRCALRVLGSHKGQPVGMTVDVLDIRPNPDRSVSAGPGKILLRSDGQITTNFAQLLAQLYKHPQSKFRVPAEIQTSAVTLEGDAARLQTEPVKFKLFHGEEDGAPDYFEMFLNLDVPHHVVEFAEKDPDYRMPILRSLGAKL